MAEPATPLLDKIIGGESIGCSHSFQAALREILSEAEKWVGHDFELVCDEQGWSIRYVRGDYVTGRLCGRYGYRFPCAEDAIQALVDLITKTKGEVERENAEIAGAAQ